jgi:hypothetical protein
MAAGVHDGAASGGRGQRPKVIDSCGICGGGESELETTRSMHRAYYPHQCEKGRCKECGGREHLPAQRLRTTCKECRGPRSARTSASDLKYPRLPVAGCKAKMVQYIADAGAQSPGQGKILWGRIVVEGGLLTINK